MKSFGKQKGDVLLGFILLFVVVFGGALIWKIIKDSSTPPYTRDISNGYEMDEGLEGCKVHYLHSNKNKNLFVVRCPFTTSTYWEETNGKITNSYSSTIGNY